MVCSFLFDVSTIFCWSAVFGGTLGRFSSVCLWMLYRWGLIVWAL